MPEELQIQEWKDKVDGYKKTYYGMYGKHPSEKLIMSFCNIYNIPWPLPKPEDIDLDFLN